MRNPLLIVMERNAEKQKIRERRKKIREERRKSDRKRANSHHRPSYTLPLPNPLPPQNVSFAKRNADINQEIKILGPNVPWEHSGRKKSNPNGNKKSATWSPLLNGEVMGSNNAAANDGEGKKGSSLGALLANGQKHRTNSGGGGGGSTKVGVENGKRQKQQQQLQLQTGGVSDSGNSTTTTTTTILSNYVVLSCPWNLFQVPCCGGIQSPKQKPPTSLFPGKATKRIGAKITVNGKDSQDEFDSDLGPSDGICFFFFCFCCKAPWYTYS